jgi:hypothetical protein
MKTLVKYLRDDTGRKTGVIVALSKDQIGWSALHPEDQLFDGNRYVLWNEKQAMGRAIKRAEQGYDVVVHEYYNKVFNRFGYYPDDADLIASEFSSMVKIMREVVIMHDRAKKYYKEQKMGNGIGTPGTDVSTW